ncbi:MAG: serine--tRNA ligase [Anaerolineaceae bacterium]|nr:serine--tRNA ligase [Anaerolineaceae bacterium]MCB9100478.1 serine--tRNA ligase [Anaerolineales bacterium]
MLDLNFIRENAELVKAKLVDLNTEAPIDDILRLDEQRRELLKEVEALRQERNTGSKAIGLLMREGKKAEAEAQKTRMGEIGDKIKELDETLRQVEADLLDKQLYVPNMPGPDVPVGPNEDHNIEVRRWGDPPQFDFAPKPHWDLGEDLGIIDFERGVKISGTRFYVFKGAGAALHRALANWFIDTGVNQHGYTEIYPPFMVREQAMVGAAHLPKFRDNMYYDAEEDYWFIGTAEVPLTNIFADEILEADQLPIRYLAHTPCFRREKMSAGRDVRGIKRVHQFEKVEMYHYTLPENSYDHLEEIVANAEDLCRQLNIPHRVLKMCTGDLGFAAAKKYDVEAWVPGPDGQGEWMEISSCSNVVDFQARRANIRFRREPGAKPEYIHTLNGSGLPPGRVMIAVMENYQQADGSIVVPEVLRPYMGGLEVINK